MKSNIPEKEEPFEFTSKDTAFAPNLTRERIAEISQKLVDHKPGASIEEVPMEFDPPSMWVAVCMCCRAQGPVATTRGCALIMWDARSAPGGTDGFCKLADRLAGFGGKSQ